MKRKRKELDTAEKLVHEFARIIVSPLRCKGLCWCGPRADFTCALCAAMTACEKLYPGRLAALKNKYGLHQDDYPPDRLIEYATSKGIA